MSETVVVLAFVVSGCVLVVAFVGGALAAFLDQRRHPPRSLYQLASEHGAHGTVEVRRDLQKVVFASIAWWLFLMIGYSIVLTSGRGYLILLASPLAIGWAAFVTISAVSTGPIVVDDVGIRLGRHAADHIPWWAIASCRKDKQWVSFRVDPRVVAKRKELLPWHRRVSILVGTIGAPSDAITVPAVFEVSAAELGPWLDSLVAATRGLPRP